MDYSQIPKYILPIIQDRKLSVSQKMIAFNMHMPNLPASPEHNKAYNDNLEIGCHIKKFIDELKIRLKFDNKFKVNVIFN
jgi:hypothetical protein